MNELYPLRFRPYFKEFIWGGRRLETVFHKDLPPGKTIGESWEVFDKDVITNGPLEGKTLLEAIGMYGNELLGRQGARFKKFPLIAKLTATEMNLSIQVHPNDEQAARMEPESGFTGKTEMIYILDAKPGAKVYFGFDKKVDPQTLRSHISGGGEIINLIQEVDAKAGDVFLIRPGTVHGYGAGLIYFELQQNSDITYRLYDWNRVDSSGKPRELHIQKGLEVIDYDVVKPEKIQSVCLKEEVGEDCFLTACRQFLVEDLGLSKSYSTSTEEDSFHLLCVTGGEVTLVADSHFEPELKLGLGDVVLIPASVKGYQLVPGPRSKVLRCRLPDLQKDVLSYLGRRGVSPESILTLGGSAAKNDY
jgi:mannose-6-phosphate isomerase